MFVSTFPNPSSAKTELSNEHAEIVRATLPVVGENIDEIAQTFYKTMFGNHPELLRDLFNRRNQRSGEQQRALAASVATFATQLVDDSAPDPVMMLDRIAHKHVSLGIAPDQYQIVHDNLLSAIAQVLGDAVTEDVAEAWSRVYWLMADVLIKHEKELYDSANTTPEGVFHEVSMIAHAGDREITYFHSDVAPEAFAFREAVSGGVDKLVEAYGERLTLEPADVKGADVYLCGGTSFLQNMRDQLAELEPASVHYELFSPNDWLIG